MLEERPNDEPYDEDVPLKLPLNLGLNDGTICPKSCIDVMQAHRARTSLRHYTTPENRPLLDVIAEVDGVKPENVYLANGSGPLLKQCIPWLIRRQITRSPKRIAQHLIARNGFSIVSGYLTYSKVPAKGIESKLSVELLPLGPETSFKLRMADLEAYLSRRDALVYVCNPNNPTGQLMLERDEIASLVARFPRSLFWVDEAYVQYMDPQRHQPVSDLVPAHPNLLVSRTFSFAYGLAGARIGYLLADKEIIQQFQSQVTDYRLGTLQESLAIAALTDPDHLSELRAMTARDRDQILGVLRRFRGVEAFDSHTHYVLARFTDGRKGAWLADELQKRGVKIKTFRPIQSHTYDEYFRITLGMRKENDYLCGKLAEILS